LTKGHRELYELSCATHSLRSLKKQGFVAEDNAGGWRVRPQVFLWCLTDELVRTVRCETPFEE